MTVALTVALTVAPTVALTVVCWAGGLHAFVAAVPTDAHTVAPTDAQTVAPDGCVLR